MSFTKKASGVILVIILVLYLWGCGNESQSPDFTLVADDNPAGNNSKASYYFYSWNGAITNTLQSIESGYLNGYSYSETIVGLDGSFDLDKYRQSGYWFFPQLSQVKADIFAFVPDTTISKSQKAKYAMCSFDENLLNKVCDEKTIDQSQIKDEWVLLFKDVDLLPNWGAWVSLGNVTDEPGKYVIFDAIKLVPHQ